MNNTEAQNRLDWGNRGVGELVAERPGRSRIFQEHGIEFCCQGKKTLKQACENLNVPLETIVEALEKELTETKIQGINPAELSIGELAEYVIKVHHGFLRKELPRLHQMAMRVAQVHGGHTPSLVRVYQVFENMFRELDQHLDKEEQVLFPVIRIIAKGETPTLPVEGPIATMMEEHVETGQALEELQELTHNYSPPEEACNTYRALFAGLADLQNDLHQHIHLENNVLFPAAKRSLGLTA